MNNLYIGLTYHPINSISLNLREISDKIHRGKQFSLDHVGKFYVRGSSFDGQVDFIIYYDGVVYYRKRMGKGACTVKELKNLAKESYSFIQKYLPVITCSKELGIVIQGDNAKAIYTSKRSLISDFSRELFRTPQINENELEISDRRAHVLLSPKETPFMIHDTESSEEQL